MWIYATHAHFIHEDPEEWRRGSAHEVHRILQGFMESVEQAIKDGELIKYKDGGAYIDLFRIPQWFYDKVAKDQETLHIGEMMEGK